MTFGEEPLSVNVYVTILSPGLKTVIGRGPEPEDDVVPVTTYVRVTPGQLSTERSGLNSPTEEV